MPSNILSIELRESKNGLTVQAIGQTPRGTRFLKQHVYMKAQEPDDPDFKRELAEAVAFLVNWGAETPR